MKIVKLINLNKTFIPLTKTDRPPRRLLALSYEGGQRCLHPHWSREVYRGEFALFGEGVGNYWGESGDSDYFCLLQHQAAIWKRDKTNLFANHRIILHQSEEGRTISSPALLWQDSY